ncbi:MAG: response regulator transcription factor, partial [Thermoanaerobaculia bacterium]
MATMPDEIRIVVADDHPVLRLGLKQVIEADPRLRVVGEADDGEAALEQIEAQQPD